MKYEMYDRGRGGMECPKCKFTMEPLRDSAYLNREFGYELDNNTRWNPNGNPVSAYLFGNITAYLWQNFLEPLAFKMWGDRQNKNYRRILQLYPNTLICTHCEYVQKER